MVGLLRAGKLIVVNNLLRMGAVKLFLPDDGCFLEAIRIP
jgi:hypothetical protein